MCADIVVVPEVKSEIHRFPVALPEQRLDVPGKTGCAACHGHDALLSAPTIFTSDIPQITRLTQLSVLSTSRRALLERPASRALFRQPRVWLW